MTIGGWFRKHWKGVAVLAAAVPALMFAGFLWFDRTHPVDLGRYEARSMRIADRGGETLRIFPVEDGRIRLAAPLEDIDPAFTAMLLAFEDQRFFDHGGVDFRALVRATWQAATTGHVVSGGSTITMQTARLLMPKPRTFGAKLTEMVHAWQLERRFSKQEILQIYLTLAPYGGNIEGVAAASTVYFGHMPRQLAPHEAALLVALPQSPTSLRPDRAPKAAFAARNKVLHRTARFVGMDADALRLALKAPVPTARRDLPLIAPHYTDRLYAAHRGADTVETAIDGLLQKKLETLAARAAGTLNAHASAAILVVDNKTRQVLAYVGSAGLDATDRDGFVDMVAATRSPGSTLKPFIYGMAFDRGLARPTTIIRDEPKDFHGYAPANFMDRHYGDITIAEALQRSLNVPAVAVLDRLGAVSFTERLRDTGVRLALPGDEVPGLAVALGGLGMRLEDLVALYAALADDGTVRPLMPGSGSDPAAFVAPEVPFVASATGSDPVLLHDATKLLDTRSRAALTRILAGIAAPDGRLSADFRMQNREIAYKTGTSYGYRDAWAIGYDADHTIGVWLGRPDGTPLPGHFGSNTAAPLLFSAFELLPMPRHALVQQAENYGELPPGLKYFDRPARLMRAHAGTPTLAIRFPIDDTIIELSPDDPYLTLEAAGGRRPLQWFVNGRPEPQKRWAQTLTTRLPSAGFYSLVVVDADGRRAAAQVRVRLGTASGFGPGTGPGIGPQAAEIKEIPAG
ncbi:MAG: penicillin-binding protein 1C [Alphaproteobacteria bacterium]|nr:MAG: penicillin-binding protein 1C [Alphaproteobacteria bacterium]